MYYKKKKKKWYAANRDLEQLDRLATFFSFLDKDP